MTDFDRYADFDAAVDRLGLEAVSAKGTPEFIFAFRRLCDYFKGGMFYFFLRKSKISPSEFEKSFSGSLPKEKEDALERVNELCAFYLSKNAAGKANYIALLERLVRDYSEENSGDSKLHFFSYLYNNLKWKIKNEKAEQYYSEKHHGLQPISSDTQRRLLSKLRKVFNAMERTVSPELLRETAAELGLSYEAAREVWMAYSESEVYSLDMPMGDNGDTSLKDMLPGDEDVLDPELLNSESAVFRFLTILNDIYRQSFQETHRIAFPPYLTKRMADARVADKQRSSENYSEALIAHWDEIDLPGMREIYTEEEFLCIRKWVFDAVIDLKRQITEKEIAESIGMRPSSFSKAVKRAEKLLQKNA